MNSDFFEFISQLSNLEKTRNFNVFSGYSLEPFENVLKKYEWNRRRKETLCRISVVGTNAKGSITHFLGEFFRLSGFKTGLYTSPHLLSPLERIRIGSQTEPFRQILKEELDVLLSEMEAQGAEADLKTFSFFELFTCAAFRFFEKNSVEIQIYEAGLGGRLDATKLANPDVVVLGSIGLDHKEILGNSKLEILEEKLGICSKNTKFLFAMEQKESELNLRIQKFCDQHKIVCETLKEEPLGADYLTRNRSFSLRVWGKITDLRKIGNSKFEFNSLNLAEVKNRVSPPPGRLTVLRNSPLLVFDPAHNPDAFSETFRSLDSLYPDKKFRVFTGLLRDKDGSGILEFLRNAKERGSIAGFYFLKEEGFHLPEDCRENEMISLREMNDLLKSSSNLFEPILVLGSFRLFPIVSGLI
ncbi:bifunctional folylpolyglutamate synthase/dihydrofolate synthase [Leptospira tipperaryensis]|uniref:Bifunctional folylpolyglutamate synthase/dihydrofolate synthase n=1 Tax=Leptospira tipperaryensis TaxID=2564040 RepID=A0A1D7V052_9LEPT|nr:bifunctional folylpolyglutamate synthase/dihydrofolate synthase [Leptospira tipperaryensis]AOP35215.1 bifunctional folylpolyglutamate synthase/dihydrofolate synthase [Leptospira tipperaryensis]